MTFSRRSMVQLWQGRTSLHVIEAITIIQLTLIKDLDQIYDGLQDLFRRCLNVHFESDNVILKCHNMIVVIYNAWGNFPYAYYKMIYYVTNSKINRNLDRIVKTTILLLQTGGNKASKTRYHASLLIYTPSQHASWRKKWRTSLSPRPSRGGVVCGPKVSCLICF